MDELLSSWTLTAFLVCNAATLGFALIYFIIDLVRS